MKKYRFGLGGVKRVREIVEEQSRAALVQAQADMADATRLLDDRLASIGAARTTPGLRTSHDFLAEHDLIDRHLMAVTAARVAEANARLNVSLARESWVTAAQEVRILERLDDRRHEAWLLETTRQAQLVTDEIAVTHGAGGQA
jgi:flagellar export protein FliJ